MAIKGVSVAAIGIGGILVWSALFNKKITQTIQDLVRGQQPQPGSPSTAGDTAAEGGGSPIAPPGPVGKGAAANRALGRAMAASVGWVGAQWDALDWIWNEESGWSTTAENPSGAYGIPQALPGSKMGALANPPTPSAIAQIRWGLRYIRQRYGNPVNAKAFHLTHGWY